MSEWRERFCREKMEEATTYPDKALWYVVNQSLQQQEARIAQLQGQLDGHMWNPSGWTEFDETSSS